MIGRKEEIESLREAATADRSRFIVVYGRRRVGKTFLIREAFDYRFTFSHTGMEASSMPFSEVLRSRTLPYRAVFL